MRMLSRVVDRALALPPAVTRDVEVSRGLRVPMADGAGLLADRYAPRRVADAPTILVRTPYGRGGRHGLGLGRPFAERGYQVLVQACRGTDGSDGVFDPFGREREDGLATLDWIEKQPWFRGNLLTFGPSYMGYAQWALAPDAGERITAMVPVVSASQFRDQTYLGDSFTIRGALNWSARMTGRVNRKRVRAAMEHLPLSEADRLATGRRVEWYQAWLASVEPGHAYWVPERDHRARVGAVTAPVSMVGGWYDLFLSSQLDDYAAMRRAGRDPYLTIGPWVHGDRAGFGAAVREALGWFRAQVTGDRNGLRELPVRLYVQGAEEWRDYAEWPPPAREQVWFLQAGRGLAAAPGEFAPDRFRYDPADPTPGAGGPLLDRRAAGRRDQAAVEARDDVLVYTSEPLPGPVEVIGPVSALIRLRSSREHTDVFVRLCEVDARGRSLNVCDGLQRVTPERFPADADGVRPVRVRLWPTAYRFRAGNRLRVHVAGGSFPRFARNPGTGEPLASAVRLAAADQEVLPGSGITLPLV